MLYATFTDANAADAGAAAITVAASPDAKPVVVSETPVPDDVDRSAPDELYHEMEAVTVRAVTAVWMDAWNAYVVPTATAIPEVPVGVFTLNAAAVDAVSCRQCVPESAAVVGLERVQFVPAQPVVPVSKDGFVRRFVRVVTDNGHLHAG